MARRETGATLHYMTAKPDDGDIVAQTAVPILPDDTRGSVRQGDGRRRAHPARRAARARCRHRAAARRRISRRRPISAAASPRTASSTGRSQRAVIHNLVRAVAPPYPGARTRLAGGPRASCAPACATDRSGDAHAVAPGRARRNGRALRRRRQPRHCRARNRRRGGAAAALAELCAGQPIPLRRLTPGLRFGPPGRRG